MAQMVRIFGGLHVPGVLALTSVMILLYGKIDRTSAAYSGWDLWSYLRMAEAAPLLAVGVEQPFAYRLFGPYVVGLLPVPEPMGFYAFTVASSLGLAVVFWHFLCSVGLSPVIATVSVAMFTFNKHWFGLTVWNFYQINDVLSLVFVTLLFWTMTRGLWTYFGSVLLFASLTRETGMLLVPVSLVYLVEKGEMVGAGHRWLLAVIPALVGFAAVRFGVEAEGGLGPLEALLAYAPKLASPEALVRIFVNSWLPITFLPLVFARATLSFFQGRIYLLIFLLLVLFSSLFGSNVERLVAPAFIVVYWLLGSILQETPANRPWFLLLLLICGFFSSLHHLYGLLPLPGPSWSFAVWFGALALVTGAALIVRFGGAAVGPRINRSSPEM